MIPIQKDLATKLKNKTFIDLFAGIGGFRLAFESFGASCVYSSEWDKSAQIVYKMNFGEIPDGDITKVSANEIPKHNILCAGFPCQAFSISGSQRGFEDTRGTLFFEIARIAKLHQPEILFLENVKNLEKHDHGHTLETIKKVLKEIGYDVSHKVLNASYYGIPQKRERIYIIGFHKRLGIKNFEFPPTQNIYMTLKDILLSDEKTEKLIIKRKDVTMKKHIKVEIDMFGHYPLKPIRVGVVNKGGQGERIYHECGHAITLSAYGGGVGAKTGLYLVNGKIRKLATRECARLMGFPDSFKIASSESQAYKQFGNSVVVNVLQLIIIEFFKKGVLK